MNPEKAAKKLLTPSVRRAIYAFMIALQPMLLALGVSFDMEQVIMVVEAACGVVTAFMAGQHVPDDG